MDNMNKEFIIYLIYFILIMALGAIHTEDIHIFVGMSLVISFIFANNSITKGECNND